MNYCTARFRCKKDYGCSDCDFYENDWGSDCVFYDPHGRQSCINIKAREAAINKLNDMMRDRGDG